MADAMEEILGQAKRLGELIRNHPRYARLREADDRVRADASAAQALEAYNKAIALVRQKERSGRPVEVEEKHNVERLQQTVAANEAVKGFMAAQADYAELMRKMNDAIFRAITADEQAAPPTQ